MMITASSPQIHKSATLPVKKTKPKRDGRRTVRSMGFAPIEVAMAPAHRYHKAPNMSRKISGFKLYPFPSFDRCDSLLFFPTTFTSFINTADYEGLSQLLKSRLSKDCELTVQGHRLDIDYFVAGYELSHDVHPDSICCVHSTKVVGNQIRSLVYFKYTENKALRRAMENSSRDTSALRLCPTPKTDSENLEDFLAAKPAEEKLALRNVLETAEEIVVYGTSLLIITFNDFTKKVACFDMQCEYTSFGAVV